MESSPEEVIEWTEAIVNDIAQGKCVLFLGPELLISKDGKYYKAFFKELEDSNKLSIKYFSKDNLFSIIGSKKDLEKKQLAIRVSNFYKDAGDEIILDLVSKIPFSLIINVCPDISINKFFDKNNYPYNSAYFKPYGNPDTPQPTLEKPLIYNIFGHISDNQSLILTHADLFKNIKSLTQNGKIPPQIEEHLKQAGSFIFLGLKFETWYYQLLLTILEIEQSDSYRIGAPDEIDIDTVSIMDSYLKIHFEKRNPLKIVQHIHDSLLQHGVPLRQPTIAPPRTAVYMSYAWNDDTDPKREEYVNLLYNELTNNNVNVFIDRNVLTIQDSIESFMNRIGRGKAVAMIISDKYLKSDYCMYEAWQIYRNNDFDKRAYIAILPDVDLTDNGKANYIKFWRDKKNDFESHILTNFINDNTSTNHQITKFRNISYIHLFISDLLNILTDTLHYSVPKEIESISNLDQNQHQLFIEKILNELKGQQ